MIGIGITTHNRYDVFRKSLLNIYKYLPDNCHVVVVDDGSDVPVEGSNFRFEDSRGIAASKNKCIELLVDKGCDEFFLFDDDTYPIKKDWHLSYINSSENHLSYTFHMKKDGTDNGRGYIQTIKGHNIYNAPCGCMLYFNKKVVEKVGGLDINYGKWGFEHASFSDRVYNNKLTSRRYMDIYGSDLLLYCLDQDQVAPSSNWQERKIIIKENKSKYYKGRISKEYVPYVTKQHKGVIVCSYLNGKLDPQRKIKWNTYSEGLNRLINSCDTLDVNIKVIHDCFDKNDSKFIKIKSNLNYSPNIYRWILYNDFFERLTQDYDAVFFVDSTDVELLKNPFNRIREGFIYSGSEYNQRTTNRWMSKTQQPLIKIPNYKWLLNVHGNDMLLNCGVVGGTKEVMKTFIKGLAAFHINYSKGIEGSVDMATYNYYCRKHWNDQIIAGINITSKFKENDRNNISIFKHK